MKTSFYSPEELKDLGFAHVGEDVLLSRKASIYGASHIAIGNHVRIDDFCILSGNIVIGSYIHISAFCGLYGGDGGIELCDYSGVSPRTVIFADSDDFSGNAMIGPMVPERFRNVISGKVTLNKYVQIGTGSTILPGAVIGEGTSVGSMSLVTKSLDPWGIYVGIPCRRIKERSRKLLELERRLREERKQRDT